MYLPGAGCLRVALVGLTNEQHSWKAFEYALNTFDPGEWKLVLVTVVEDVKFSTVVSLTAREAVEALQANVRKAHVLVDDAVKVAESRGFKVEGYVFTGDPGEQLVNAARAYGAEIIVLGCRPLSKIKRFLLGSVSRKVLELADTNVLIVK
jgi:nucleotide-binding universal stress UspA family protein